MKADPERPEQIAEQIVQSGYGYEQIKEAIAAAIHAERAQTARIREKLTTLARWVADTDCCYGAACMAQKIENRLREAAAEDQSHE